MGRALQGKESEKPARNAREETLPEVYEELVNLYQEFFFQVLCFEYVAIPSLSIYWSFL